MNNLKNELNKYRRTGDLEKLRQYISKLNLETVTEFLSSVWLNSDATQLVQSLLLGFGQTTQSIETLQQVLKYMMKQLCTKALSADAKCSILGTLWGVLQRLSVKHLVELTTITVDMVHIGDANTNWLWSKVLPMLIKLLQNQNTINYNGTDFNGIAFKTEIINALCIVRWPSEIIIDLASMFSNMELSKEDNNKVCNKLCSSMIKMQPASIPLLTQHLLALCSIYGDIYPIFFLCNYFSIALYKDPQHKLFKHSVDIEYIDINAKELMLSEQKVLFYMQSVFNDSSQHKWITNFLRALRTINKWPEFVLCTFNMMLLLAMASDVDLRVTIYEIIRIALLRNIKALQLIKESAWLRKTVTDSETSDELFSKLIDISVKDNVIIIEGLIGLGVNLLQYSGDFNRQVNKIGVFILVKMASKHTKLASSIINQIMFYVNDESSGLQHSYCFHHMINCMPLALIENHNVILNGIVKTSEQSQKYMFSAIMPLIKYSRPMRNSFAMLFYKNIHSGDTIVRELGAYGLCLIIENLKIDVPNKARLSQQTLVNRNSSSFHSQFGNTQVNINMTCDTSFETSCLEILEELQYSIMKRSSTKCEIYKGLKSAALKNPPICCYILEILFENLQQYISANNECNINFDKLIKIDDENIIVNDSLGRLITCITSVLTKALDTEKSLNNHRTLQQIIEFLNSLCLKIKDCNLDDFGLKKDFDLADDNLHIMRNNEKLSQLMMIQESLIIYKISLWELQAQDKSATEIVELFKNYKLFIEYSKTICLKTKKQGKEKNKGNQSESKVQQANTAIKFKIPKTLLTLPILKKIIEISYSETEKSYTEQIRAYVEFHQYTFQSMANVLQDVDNSLEMIDRNSKKELFLQLSQCETIIYENCLLKLNVLSDFDLTTTILASEAFLKILQLIDKHYERNFFRFISALHSVRHVQCPQGLLGLMLSEFQIFLKKYLEDEDALDQDSRITLSLIYSVQILSKYLLTSSESLLFKTAEWLKSFLMDIKNNRVAVAKALFGLYISFDTRIRIISTFCSDAATQVCSILGTINEDQVNTSTTLSIINEGTFEVIVQSMCDNFKDNLSKIDWVIQYISGYYMVCVNIQNFNSGLECEYLEEKESSICTHLCHIIYNLITISNSQLPPGISTDALFKSLQSLYETISNLTKYFLKRAVKAQTAFMKARFDKVVKLAGRKLCSTIYKLITHIEEMQDNKTKSKVLRETRIIPNLVFAMETFKRSIMQLSMKTNSSAKEILISGLDIGTTRDFRLHLETLQEALNNSKSVNETDGTVIPETDEESVIDNSCSSEGEQSAKRIKLKK